MEQVQQAIDQHLVELEQLFKMLMDVRVALGGVTVVQVNEMRTFVISANAAAQRLRALARRFPAPPAVAAEPMVTE
uniref:Protein B2 n=1 Tax=Solea senegalensis betanodavirus TaxID=1110528 RepID=S5DJF7_9VIRU|nr:protein B2 [Solea senegalensis betanodavirus]